MLLRNKNAVIYGAGGAIGSADARALAREGSIPDGQEEQIVTQEFGTQRNSDVTFRSMLSRRAMLRGLAATAIAATGQARAGNAFANADPAITPFTYHAPQSALDDLKQRLAQTRWPERETVADWSQGVPLAKLRALVEYWRTGSDDGDVSRPS